MGAKGQQPAHRPQVATQRRKYPVYMVSSCFLKKALSNDEQRMQRKDKLFFDRAMQWANRIDAGEIDIWSIDSNQSNKTNVWLVNAQGTSFSLKCSQLPESRLLYVTQRLAKKNGYSQLRVVVDRAKPEAMEEEFGITASLEKDRRYLNDAHDLLSAKGFQEESWQGERLVMVKNLS